MSGKSNAPVKYGFWGLTAIAFGMMVGAGIFNIPQNMATAADLKAVAVSWVVTAIGMLLLVATFKILADHRPELTAGIYQYAHEGWGSFVGFNMAWGYWLCTAFANVAYAVMLNDAFGAFIPGMINSSWSLIISGTILIWLMYFLVRNGMKTAKFVNDFLAVLKVVVIAVIIVLIAINIKLDTFSMNYNDSSSSFPDMASQVKDTMMVTLWCFIGIEGAAMMSAHAKRSSDVGKAGIAGFFISWILYLLVSILCFGVLTRVGLENLQNPSVAYVLKEICGSWAYYFVIIAVIVSLLGGWVSWTLITAQVPHEAASVGIFPKKFLKLNRNNMPTFGLCLSSLIMQGFLLVVVAAKNVYLAALSVTGMMILPTYLLSALYLWKASSKNCSLGNIPRSRRIRYRFIGLLCSLFCLWMIFSGGLDLFLFTSVFYAAGIPFYIKAKREASGNFSSSPLSLFSKPEIALLLIIIACSIATVCLIATGTLHLF